MDFGKLLQSIRGLISPQPQAYIPTVDVSKPMGNGLSPVMQNKLNTENNAFLKNWNKDITPTQAPQPTPFQHIVNTLRAPLPSPTPPPDAAAQPYVQLINDSAAKYGVPQNIFYNLLRAESNFNPNATSPVGALGIAQFMPSTAAGLGIDPMNPTQAIPAAAQYLSDKIKRHGDIRSAVASYNAGSGAVDKYGGVPPFPETQAYVKKIFGQ